jgi:hypothetical protein
MRTFLCLASVRANRSEIRNSTPLRTRFPRRDQEFRWLKANREQYKGKWVALFGANLIATGDSMKEVLDAVKAQQIVGTPLVHKVE